MRVLPLLPLVAALGCAELPGGLARFQGTFSYMAADSIGRPAFGGTLRLFVRADSTITGTHDLVGYRVAGGGAPTLAGRVHGDSIFLWLDPNPDGGILINALATGGGFAGSWASNTIAGPRPGGGFFAQRTDPLLP